MGPGWGPDRHPLPRTGPCPAASWEVLGAVRGGQGAGTGEGALGAGGRGLRTEEADGEDGACACHGLTRPLWPLFARAACEKTRACAGSRCPPRAQTLCPQPPSALARGARLPRLLGCDLLFRTRVRAPRRGAGLQGGTGAPERPRSPLSRSPRPWSLDQNGRPAVPGAPAQPGPHLLAPGRVAVFTGLGPS